MNERMIGKEKPESMIDGGIETLSSFHFLVHQFIDTWFHSFSYPSGLPFEHKQTRNKSVSCFIITKLRSTSFPHLDSGIKHNISFTLFQPHISILEFSDSHVNDWKTAQPKFSSSLSIYSTNRTEPF